MFNIKPKLLNKKTVRCNSPSRLKKISKCQPRNDLPRVWNYYTDFNIATITMLQGIKKNILEINRKIRSLNREVKSI